YVQKWTGSELCNSIIYDNGTRVGIGTASPQAKLDVVDSVVIGSQGNLPNGVTAELHLGRQVAPSGNVGEIKRLAIQPYGNTAGPFFIVAKDTNQFSFLDFRFNSESAWFIQKDTLSGFRGIGIGDISNIGPAMLRVAKKTNSVPFDPTTLLASFSLLDSSSAAHSTLSLYGYLNSTNDYIDSTFMLYTPFNSATKHLQITVAKPEGQIRFHIGGWTSPASQIMNIRKRGVLIRTDSFHRKCGHCPLQVNGRMMLRSWDAVYMSGYDGVPQKYFLIGTYMGWDREAIYIPGYHYYFPAGGDTLNSYAKRVRFGAGGSPNQVVVDLKTSSLGVGTDAPTEKLHVNGNIRSKSAFTVTVNGCNNNVCTYTVNFPVPFSTPPVVHITPGPNANPSWVHMSALIQNVTTTDVTFKLDTGNPSQNIIGTKTIHIIAIAP
ncbi:MAG: hypothetical protein GXO48_00920, partial [Chlorobi bacterium]|nr:hypothetical protein [Chlorobiota bacterium]